MTASFRDHVGMCRGAYKRWRRAFFKTDDVGFHEKGQPRVAPKPRELTAKEMAVATSAKAVLDQKRNGLMKFLGFEGEDLKQVTSGGWINGYLPMPLTEILLSSEEYEAVLLNLANPPAPNQALCQAMMRVADREQTA